MARRPRRAEAGCGVGHAHAGDQRDEPCEERDPDAPAERRAIVAAAHEARAHDDVRVAVGQRRDQAVDLLRRVLAVAVDLDRDVVAAFERDHVARLHGAADAEVEGQRDHARAGAHRLGSRPVAGAVVDHDDIGRREALDVPTTRAIESRSWKAGTIAMAARRVLTWELHSPTRLPSGL